MASATCSAAVFPEPADSFSRQTSVCDKAGEDRVSVASKGSVMDKIRS